MAWRRANDGLVYRRRYASLALDEFNNFGQKVYTYGNAGDTNKFHKAIVKANI